VPARGRPWIANAGAHDKELVTTVSPGLIRRSDAITKTLGNRHEELVAHMMAVLVVNGLEVVQIEVDPGHPSAVSDQVGRERLHDGSTVLEPGQRIGIGHAPQLGDIDHASKDPEHGLIISDRPEIDPTRGAGAPIVLGEGDVEISVDPSTMTFSMAS